MSTLYIPTACFAGRQVSLRADLSRCLTAWTMHAIPSSLRSNLLIQPAVSVFLRHLHGLASSSLALASSGSTSKHSRQNAVPEKLPFKKVLVANRGAIAARIFRTARKMGLKTVAVFSDEDAGAYHTRFADEAYYIGPSPSTESYLRMDCILEACRQSGADAVHPGYGFLSENTKFAELLEANGITFVGPPASAIHKLGDKIQSKRLAAAANVRSIPGFVGEVKNYEQAVEVVQSIGYPVMIKASAGGGGKGMRIAHNNRELVQGYKLAQAEAASSFGDDRLLFEKYFERPRHIEVQVLGDKHGNVVWLPERECSIQRRHQKVIEEAPSVAVDPELRRALGEQAVALARAAGYYSAGTVEFLMDDDKQFYFLEMNTRLQVEHSVTEDITGLDLVEQMLLVAAGRKLQISQEEASKVDGWSIQCRILAEDPSRNFMPNAGRLTAYRRPKGMGIRLLSGVENGDGVSHHYDSLISKVVAHGVNRDAALHLLCNAMDNYVIRGPANNLAWLRDVLGNPRFQAGDLSTSFIAEEYGKPGSMHPENFKLSESDEEKVVALAVLQHMEHTLTLNPKTALDDGYEVVATSPSGTATKATVRQASSMMASCVGGGDDVSFSHMRPLEIELPRAVYQAHLLPQVCEQDARDFTPLLRHADLDGEVHCYQVFESGPRKLRLQFNGAQRTLFVDTPFAADLIKHMKNVPKGLPAHELRSPMSGSVVEVVAAAGQAVVAGDALCVVEAMKMQNVLKAEADGTIKEILVERGATVSSDQVLMTFKPL